MANDWSKAEVEAAVEDYFNMLRAELTGRRYNKTAHRHDLIMQLDGRSDGSVELKHQNISAVLIEMGTPYIDGYKPRFNYQRLLSSAVGDYLEQHPDLQSLFKADVGKTPEVPKVEDLLLVMEKPPVHEQKQTQAVKSVPAVYNPLGINYLEEEARNQSLGEAGEQFVINFERARLIRAGKDALADRIEQVSATRGPSAGFDIRSFEFNGTDRFIEAKTTKYGKSTPFFITSNEVRFSHENKDQYYLYRIFKFREAPRIFTLHGQIEDHCVLKPTEFIASPGRQTHCLGL